MTTTQLKCQRNCATNLSAAPMNGRDSQPTLRSDNIVMILLMDQWEHALNFQTWSSRLFSCGPPVGEIIGRVLQLPRMCITCASWPRWRAWKARNEENKLWNKIFSGRSMCIWRFQETGQGFWMTETHPVHNSRESDDLVRMAMLIHSGHPVPTVVSRKQIWQCF